MIKFNAIDLGRDVSMTVTIIGQTDSNVKFINECQRFAYTQEAMPYNGLKYLVTFILLDDNHNPTVGLTEILYN